MFIKTHNYGVNNWHNGHLVQVEGLEKCEALEKLDLTLNFVDLQNLPSIVALKANVHLKDLYDNKSNSLSHYQCSTVHMVNACKLLKGKV